MTNLATAKPLSHGHVASLPQDLVLYIEERTKLDGRRKRYAKILPTKYQKDAEDIRRMTLFRTSDGIEQFVAIAKRQRKKLLRCARSGGSVKCKLPTCAVCSDDVRQSAVAEAAKFLTWRMLANRAKKEPPPKALLITLTSKSWQVPLRSTGSVIQSLFAETLRRLSQDPDIEDLIAASDVVLNPQVDFADLTPQERMAAILDTEAWWHIHGIALVPPRIAVDKLKNELTLRFNWVRPLNIDVHVKELQPRYTREKIRDRVSELFADPEYDEPSINSVIRTLFYISKLFTADNLYGSNLSKTYSEIKGPIHQEHKRMVRRCAQKLLKYPFLQTPTIIKSKRML